METLRWDRPPALARAGGGLPAAAPSGFLEEKLLWKRRWMCQPGGSMALEQQEAPGCSECTEGLLGQRVSSRGCCWSRRCGDGPGTDPAGALPPPPTRLNHPAGSGLCQDCPLSCCHQGLLWPCLRQHPWGWMEQQHKIKDKTSQECDSRGITACCFPAASPLEQRVTGTNSQGWRPQVLAVPSPCP